MKFNIKWKDEELGSLVIKAENIAEVYSIVKSRFGYFENEVNVEQVHKYLEEEMV